MKKCRAVDIFLINSACRHAVRTITSSALSGARRLVSTDSPTCAGVFPRNCLPKIKQIFSDMVE